jgi:hypothetical protein
MTPLSGKRSCPHFDPSDSTPSSKRFRPSAPIDTQLAPVAASTEEEDDAETMVNNAASRVSNLTLEPDIPRSLSSESGMPL